MNSILELGVIGVVIVKSTMSLYTFWLPMSVAYIILAFTGEVRSTTRSKRGKKQIKFSIPEGIKFEKVDVYTGTLADSQSIETMNVAVKEETVILPRAIESIPVELDLIEPSTTSELTNVPNP